MPAGGEVSEGHAVGEDNDRRHGELIIDDQTAAQLMTISAASIDGRLAEDRAELVLKGRSLPKPGRC
jgi:hypothetical protein